MTLPDNRTLSARWLCVARRLQSVARTRGHAIVCIKVVVDHEGEPVVWCEPEVTRVEPSEQSIRGLLVALAETGT